MEEKHRKFLKCNNIFKILMRHFFVINTKVWELKFRALKIKKLMVKQLFRSCNAADKYYCF